MAVGARADVLLHWMGVIELYTLGRALKGLTQEEMDWEPHPGAWGVRRRDACATPNPMGEVGEWVGDFDVAVAEAAFRGGPLEPMPTIGWLLNHFGAAPGLVAELTIVGGPTEPTIEAYQRMWGFTIIPDVDGAVRRIRDGWSALRTALETTTDEQLERDYPGHPWRRGDHAVGAMLNEVSHHGTQVCVLRDLFHHRAGR